MQSLRWRDLPLRGTIQSHCPCYNWTARNRRLTEGTRSALGESNSGTTLLPSALPLLVITTILHSLLFLYTALSNYTPVSLEETGCLLTNLQHRYTASTGHHRSARRSDAFDKSCAILPCPCKCYFRILLSS